MDILELIKDKLTDSVIEKVSNFLGEHPENIGSALNSSMPIVLGGIMGSASNDEEVGKVMDVLKDGGHTGEILEDLPNLLSNFDKTQLLITIGSNIFNHFTGSKGNSIVEKLSILTGIRKTSASSLVGLAAPLVLGALGKVVNKEGLGVSGLTRLLADQRESVFGALPPAIANKLNFKNTTSTVKPESEEKPKEISNDTKETKGFLSWIPWILVGLIFLAGLAYFWKYRKSVQPSEYATKIDILPKQDSTSIDNEFSAATPTDTSTVFTNTEVITATEEAKTPEKVAVEKPKVEETKKVEVIKPEETKVKETPKVTENVSSSGEDISQQLKSSKSWISLNTNFKNNSAEISSKGDLDAVVKYLKGNRNSKITIAGGSQSSKSTLGEDRAYAIREVLLEKGISENQILIQSLLVKDVDAKVVLKVK